MSKLIAALLVGYLTPLLAGPTDLKMAITVDDLPVAPSRLHSTAEQVEITHKLLDVLKRHRVPAIGFVNENKLEVDGRVDATRLAVLHAWLDAGMELGNHGYAHLDLHRVEPQTWMDDVLRGERQLRPLLAEREVPLRYFRHPFLHTGRSLAVRDATTEFLRQQGYKVAPVTIDNQEWKFGFDYARTRDPATRTKIGEAYIQYMDEVIRYYEGQALAIAGEAIPQTLLIHAYALNADWLGRILTNLQSRGYQFITLEAALEHPIYQSEDHFIGAGGITWLHRWAITRDMPGSTFAGEPDIPNWIFADQN